MKRRTTVISAIAAVALIGGGTATAVAVSDDSGSSTASRSSVRVEDDGVSDAQENAAEAKGATIKAEDAIAAALRHTPGLAVGADLDSDDGRLVWDVDVIGSGNTAWHHVEVDPGTGKVLGAHVEKDDDDDPARVASALRNASTSAEDAARAAAAKGTVTSVDADDDGSVKVWEVETTSANGTQRDWHVDLGSSTVSPDRTSDDDGNDD
ncbi:peptidase propeptide and YpeB domain protein [Streptomyces sp. SID8379]|uniref:PepSY domain-containing protein n=1 Tax=unclassified Streptomyces TaxID=2593676 RepID=UPI000376D518|nr:MULTISPECIES: PepSY domain-containing protein [unclassified Streptomyces]MYW67656.1 peptidase propeptide and YpeB domain protein [Streptomyces sp. SID8379]